MKNSRLLLRLSLILALIWPPTGVHAAAPGELNYQGKLADVNGNPITSTSSNTININFEICSAPAPTACDDLFTQNHANVSVVNGVFNVLLTAIPAMAFQGGTDRYLQISVNGMPLSPREKLVASPYALSVAAGAVGTSELVDNAVTSAKAGFNYAGSNAKGGGASSLALSSAPGQCSGGQFALGIGTNGDAQCGTLPSGLGGGTAYAVPLWTGTSSLGSSIMAQNVAASTVTVSGGLAATRLAGDGASVTNLNAGNVASGTLGAARGGTGLTSAGGTLNRVLRTTDGTNFSVGTIDYNYLASGVYGNITGLGTQGQTLDMGTHTITNVADPTLAQDAATKNYVDGRVAAGGVPALTLGTSNSAGSATTFVRTDATLAAFDSTAPAALGTAAAGAATTAARRDHVHPAVDLGTGTGLTGTLGSGRGGTGNNWSAAAKGSLPYFSAAGTMALLTPATDGNVLTLNGGSPQWQAPPAVGPWTVSGNDIINNNTGNVGIGASNPSEKLVVGNDLGNLSANTAVVVGDNAGDSAYYVGQPLTPTGAAVMGMKWIHNAISADAYGQIVTAGYSNPIKIDASSLLLQTTATGNVGVGTATPGSKLDLNGAFTMQGMATPAVSSAGQGRIYFDSTSNKFQVSENGGPYTNLGGGSGGSWNSSGTNIYNTNSGNVGIGTSGPLNGKLVIGADLGVLSANTAVVVGDNGGGSAYYVGQSGGLMGLKWIYNATAANAFGQIVTGGYSNPIKMDASSLLLQTAAPGNVGIGVAAPPTEKLEVNGNIKLGSPGNRLLMPEGVYTPGNGGPEHRVLTPGSTVRGATRDGLRRATWQFIDNTPGDTDNTVLKIDQIQDSNPSGGLIGKTGINVNHYSMPDNGGDVSGGLFVETGGGSALTAYKISHWSRRPAGFTEYSDSAQGAFEAGTSDQSQAVLALSGVFGSELASNAIYARIDNSVSKGMVVAPGNGIFDDRTAYSVGSQTIGKPKVDDNIKFSVKLNGDVFTLGYVQLGLTSGAPPAADCDSADERGRMKVDSAVGRLYICVDSGWISK